MDLNDLRIVGNETTRNSKAAPANNVGSSGESKPLSAEAVDRRIPVDSGVSQGRTTVRSQVNEPPNSMEKVSEYLKNRPKDRVTSMDHEKLLHWAEDEIARDNVVAYLGIVKYMCGRVQMAIGEKETKSPKDQMRLEMIDGDLKEVALLEALLN